MITFMLHDGIKGKTTLPVKHGDLLSMAIIKHHFDKSPWNYAIVNDRACFTFESAEKIIKDAANPLA